MGGERIPEPGNSNERDEITVRREIEAKLAHISVEQYVDLPRKTKKIVKKGQENKRLTSRELARLQAIRDKPENRYNN